MKKNTLLVALFLIAVLLRHVFGMPNIDFLMASIFSIVFLVIGEGSIKRKLMILLLVSVLSTDKITTSGINIRFDDIVSVFIVISLLFSSRNTKIKLEKVDLLLFIYLFYSAFIFLVNIYLDNTELKYIFILIKELQYFIYYYFIKTVLREEECATDTTSVITACSIANIAWGIIQVFRNAISYYGIGSLPSQYPAHSGWIFLFFLIINSYLYTRTSNRVNLLLCIMSLIMVILTVSRINIIGVVVFIVMLMLRGVYSVAKKHKIKKKVPIIGMIILMFLGVAVLAVNHFGGVYVNKIEERISKIEDAGEARADKWKYYLSNSSLLGVIVGNGKGFPEIIGGKGFILATDSQYVCQILETGMIGLFLWLLILYNVTFNYKHRDNTSHSYSIMLLVVFMIMGVTIEIFQSSLEASLFWITMAFLATGERMVVTRTDRKMIGEHENVGRVVLIADNSRESKQ